MADVAGSVPADAWTKPGLGEWTVRDLLGHALRATQTVEAYLEAGSSGPVTLQSAADYLAAGIETANHAMVAERGREAGHALGDDPSAAAAAAVERILAKVNAAADDALLTTPFGVMRLIDYLPSRTLELTVHGLDLSAALGLQRTPPVSAQTVTMALTGQMLVRRGLAPAVLLAVMGRRPLPESFTLF